MRFDEEKKKKSMKEFTIAYVNGTTFRPDMPMGNVSRSRVEAIVEAAFVGLLGEVSGSLPRCLNWLGEAIASRERLGPAPEFHIYQLNEALGVARWLSGDAIDVNAWKAAMKSELVASHEEHAYRPSDMRTLRLDDFMPVALLAGERDLAIAEYEAIHGASQVKRGSSPPLRKFGYAVALSWDSLDKDREAFFDWGRKVLAKNLDGWISHGQYIDAAKWVCLVFTMIGGQQDAAMALRTALADAKAYSP